MEQDKPMIIAGTYARVGELGPNYSSETFPGTPVPDNVPDDWMASYSQGGGCANILYLLDSGLFLSIGFWYGYEQTAAAGHWHVEGEKLSLEGVSKILMIDIRPNPDISYWYNQDFSINAVDGKPELAGGEGNGPSLLSFTDRYVYLGGRHVVVLEGSPFPTANDEIEPWIKDFLENNNPDDDVCEGPVVFLGGGFD